MSGHLDSVRLSTVAGSEEHAIGPATSGLHSEERIGVTRESRPNPNYNDVEKLRARVIKEFWCYVADQHIVVTKLPRLEEHWSNLGDGQRDSYGYARHGIEPSWHRREPFVSVRLVARGRKVRE